MLESKVTTTPWPEDEEQAFTDALGKWVRSWFRECARTGKSVTLGPETEAHLALIWRAAREYEAGGRVQEQPVKESE